MTFKNYTQKQTSLLPPSFEAFLDESHRAVIFNEFIDELDTSKLINSYNNHHGGSSAYHPVMMVKILIYAYANATFSSRKIAEKLKEDIAFMFLAGSNTPDFRTISNFRQQKAIFIKDLFLQVVHKSKDLGFVAFDTCSLDGTKIYANASTDKNYDQAKLEEKIQDLMKQAEDIDSLEDERYGDNEDDIDPDLKTKAGREKRKKQLKDKEKRVTEALRQMESSKRSRSKPKRNTTDPDSRLMKMKRKDFANGYNVQHITENGIILSNYIDNSSADQGALIPALKRLKEEQQVVPKVLLADKGFSSTENYAFCEIQDIDSYIPPHCESIDLSRYKYDKKHDTYTDKLGRVFVFKQHVERRDGKPQKGRPKKSTRLQDMHHLYKQVLYEHKDENTGKNIYLTINHDWIKYTKQQKKKLSTPQGKKIYKKRGYDVEGTFANIKKNLKFTHFNLRGKKGVETEWNLISLAHNILKITA